MDSSNVKLEIKTEREVLTPAVVQVLPVHKVEAALKAKEASDTGIAAAPLAFDPKGQI